MLFRVVSQISVEAAHQFLLLVARVQFPDLQLSVGDSPTLNKSSLKEIERMKRDELEALGLSKEQVDKVLNMHHEELDPAQKELSTVKDELEVANDKVKTQKGTIEGLKEDLKKFDGVDVTALNEKIEQLEKDIRTKDSEHAQQLAERDFQDMLKGAIASAKGKNAKAITALLDLEKLKASKNQKEDIAAELKTLSEAEDSKMLFGESEPEVIGKGNPIGVVTKTGESKNDTLKSAIAEHYNVQ